ncbi:translation initiation factor IF-2-like [Phacochoerus africanus]|uniref:translation initiation factor IF-2-like n=1 Tax=Phacochoerus africanus TaxID=41426 RepID=UPI001FDA7912|nr:translation initiation factor IF-2-like [Phacochoerus africanus]
MADSRRGCGRRRVDSPGIWGATSGQWSLRAPKAGVGCLISFAVKPFSEKAYRIMGSPSREKSQDYKVEGLCAKNAPRANLSPPSRSLPIFSEHKALRSLDADSLNAAQSVGNARGCSDHSLSSHSSAPRSRTWSLGLTYVLGWWPARLRGCAALRTGAKSQQAPFLYPPGPAPRCPRVPVFGAASVALSLRRGPSSVLPFQARVPRLQCRPAIPPLPADAAAHAPTAPSPRARVTAAAWTPECVAWCPHREGYVFGEECRPQYPGSAGRWPPEPPPEQAAAPHQLLGPRSPSLRAEKRRENFGRNFANFTLGEGEAPGMARPEAGRDGRGGPPARPGHPQRAGPPEEGRKAGRQTPGFHSSPAPPTTGPRPWVSK